MTIAAYLALAVAGAIVIAVAYLAAYGAAWVCDHEFDGRRR